MASEIGAAFVGGLLVVMGQIGNRLYDSVCRNREARNRLNSSILRASLKVQTNIERAVAAVSCFNTVDRSPGVSENLRFTLVEETTRLARSLLDPSEELVLAEGFVPQAYWSALHELHSCAVAAAEMKIYADGGWLEQDVKMEVLRRKFTLILHKHLLTMLGVYCNPPSKALDGVWTTRQVDDVFRDLHRVDMPYEKWVEQWLSSEGKRSREKLRGYLGRQPWKVQLDREEKDVCDLSEDGLQK